MVLYGLQLQRPDHGRWEAKRTGRVHYAIISTLVMKQGLQNQQQMERGEFFFIRPFAIPLHRHLSLALSFKSSWLLTNSVSHLVSSQVGRAIYLARWRHRLLFFVSTHPKIKKVDHPSRQHVRLPHPCILFCTSNLIRLLFSLVSTLPL